MRQTEIGDFAHKCFELSGKRCVMGADGRMKTTLTLRVNCSLFAYGSRVSCLAGLLASLPVTVARELPRHTIEVDEHRRRNPRTSG
jgi:hypothetical protein